MSTLSGTALGDYGHPVFKRDGFTCVYCGFDGNGFSQWRQLTVDHLKPKSQGGTDADDNLVTSCNFCNSATSRMKIGPELCADEVLALKKEHVKARLREFQKFWELEVAPRDGALTPEQGGLYLPPRLVMSIHGLEISDEQLATLTAENHDLQFEITARGELVIMPPSGGETSAQEGELYGQLWSWARKNGAGVPFGPSAGFRLPNGALLGPDAAWIVRERWEELTKEERKGFPPICPDFIMELRSPSDTLAAVQRKIRDYIENGARLAWLIDPVQRRVHVYTPDTPAEVLDDPDTVSGEPVLPGFELHMSEIW